MKALLSLSTVAIFLVAPSTCFALWEIQTVTVERAKELAMEVRSQPAGPKAVRVELEFTVEGELKDFSRVDLRFGDGNESVVTAPLREDRSKPGRVVVSLTADRARVDKVQLWVMVPFALGGSIYEVQLKDFLGGVDPNAESSAKQE